MKQRRIDVGIDSVNEVYDGAGGILWEMLMGEQIHVGGVQETDDLADRAGVNSSTHLLDVCSALGGPARHLVNKFGCRVTGLDATKRMHEEALRRTEEAGLGDKIDFKLGNALDMPFRDDTFDVVWGQDAWCYITDKERLINECARVVKQGGTVAFTDWMETGPMSDEEWTALHNFMVFPYMESLNGYASLIDSAGLTMVKKEDLSPHFAEQVPVYLDMVEDRFQQDIIEGYGREMFDAVVGGLKLWRDASAAGKVGRGRIVAKKEMTNRSVAP